MNSNYLVHHGIKGMKWGVRHDYIPVGRNGKPLTEEERKARNKRLLKIGAGVAAGILIGAGMAYGIKSGKFKQVASAGKQFYGSVHNKSGLYDDIASAGFKKRQNFSKESLINDYVYGNKFDSAERHENCMACALQRVFSSMGFECHARPNILVDKTSGLVTDGLRMETLAKAFGTKPKVSYNKTYSDISKELLSYGDGAKGVIGNTRVSKDGEKTRHAIAWFVENGQVRFEDNQPANKFLNDFIKAGKNPNKVKEWLFDNRSISIDYLNDTSIFDIDNPIMYVRIDNQRIVNKRIISDMLFS